MINYRKMEMKEPITCPSCGYVMDNTENLEDKSLKPKEGDPMICLKCQEILIFGPQALTARLPTQEDIEVLKSDPEMWRQIHFYRLAIKETLWK